MNNFIIRPARLDDAAAITEVHCSTMTTWRAPGSQPSVPYTSLDLFGRWYNGGPWMSVETCAIHLNHLLREGHVGLVAEYAGRVVGEAEYYINREPGEYAALHLSILYIHAHWQRQGVGRALLEAGLDYARALDLPALTTQPEPEASGYYQKLGFTPWQTGEEYQLRAGGSAPVDLHRITAPTCLPSDLTLRIGRYQCGAQGWETLWPYLVLPGWSDLPCFVWQGAFAGQAVILGLRQQLNDATQADAYAWLPLDAPLAPAVDALRALAAQVGYPALDLLLPADAIPALKAQFRLDFQTSVPLWRRAV